MATQNTESKSFIEWSHKVLQELTTLNAKMNSMGERHDIFVSGATERFGKIESKIESLNHLLTGNGTPEKGLLIRIDRLEQKDVEDLDTRIDRLEMAESRRTWLMRATIVACLGAIGATVASWYKKA